MRLADISVVRMGLVLQQNRSHSLVEASFSPNASMQHRSLMRVQGLRGLQLSKWIRFGPRLMRVVHGSDHTCGGNMVAVVMGSVMVFDPDKRFGSWVYGPSVAEATQKRASGVIVIDGFVAHEDSLAWCDAFLLSKKVRSLPDSLTEMPSLVMQP